VTVAPFDIGLQLERTLLAWRRSCLSLALGIAVAVRLTVPHLGAASIAVGVIGLVLVAAAWANSTQRYRRAHKALSASAPLDRGARTLAATAAVTLVLGLLGLALVLGGWRP
jgi:putative membrane protein